MSASCVLVIGQSGAMKRHMRSEHPTFAPMNAVLQLLPPTRLPGTPPLTLASPEVGEQRDTVWTYGQRPATPPPPPKEPAENPPGDMLPDAELDP